MSSLAAAVIDASTSDTVLVEEVRKFGEAYKLAVAAHEEARVALALATNAEADAYMAEIQAKEALDLVTASITTVKGSK